MPAASDRAELIRSALRQAAEPDRVPQLRRFFKTGPGEYGEGDVFIGVRVPASRQVARRFAETELDAVDELLESEIHEERLVALLILCERYRRGDELGKQEVFDHYLARTERVNSWDLVDVSAPRIVGAHLLVRPRGVLTELARSASMWERRISIVSTLTFIRADQFADTLRLSVMLFDDSQDLIHKAVGWMLREVGKRDEATLVAFLEGHRLQMPRTSLRYAIERLSPELRARLMAKG